MRRTQHLSWVFAMMRRVRDSVAAHDLQAYNAALLNIKRGNIAEVPASTHDLHGIMQHSSHARLYSELPSSLLAGCWQNMRL